MKINIPINLLILAICISLVTSAPCSENCADCGGDASVCYACQPSFQLSVLSKCNPQTTSDKCILYGPTKACFVCQPTFQIQNSKCIKHYTACLNFFDGNCIQCGFGTVLEAGKCIGTINCDNFEKTCSKCASGFTLRNSKCYPDQGCKTFDEPIGVCKQCESGFDMVGYQCIASSKKAYDCYIYNSNMTCVNCKYGFIPFENQCLLPDDIQAIQTGEKKMADILLEKKQKYDVAYAKIQAPKTTIIQPPSPIIQPFTIDNCKVADPVNKICALCQDRYFRSGSQCLMVKDLCKDYDMTNGKCTSCIDGLILQNGDCIKKVVQQTPSQPSSTPPGGAILIPQSNTQSQTIQTNQGSNTNTNSGSTTGTNSNTSQSQKSGSASSKDPNCLKMGLIQCEQCSNRFFLSPDNICVPVNPLCQNYNQKGACTSCYKGYKVSSDVCIASQSKDPYCKQVDPANICKICFDGFFVSLTKSCQPTNPLCKSSDLSNGKCTSCYQGYTLTDGSCKIFVKDPNCQEYDPNSNCLKCPSRFYINQGSCKPVSPLCKDFDRITGLCTECYPGYVNGKGICAIATSKNEDLSCKEKKNGTCISCYNGFYLNSKTNRCQLQNLICKTINKDNGNCLTCYNGYVIQGTGCVLASLQTTDLYCKTFDAKKKCTECYVGYYIDATGVCKQFDPTCKENDKKTGSCTLCYSGFNLLSGKCLSDSPALGLNADPYCIKIDGANCLQCNKGYFVATNNVCNQVDILCKAYSLENGFCTSCYTGYVLSNSKCIMGQDLYIPFCKQSNSQGKCVQCNDRYYLLKDACTPVSLLCDSYNKTTGKCTTCTPGYFFQNDQCIYPSLGVDPGCSFYTNSYCTKCKLGYYLQNFFCRQIDNQCNDFDYTKNVCNKCFNSTPQGPNCV